MVSLPAPNDPQPYRSSALAPLSLWLTEPLGIFTRITAQYTLDRHGAEFIIDSYRQAVQQLGLDCTPRKLPWVHDWSLLQRVEPTTKAQLMAFTFEIREHVASVDFVLASRASVFLRMGASVAESTLATVGLPVRSHFGENASGVLRALGLHLTAAPHGRPGA